MKLSPCHRFVILEGIHIDRDAIHTLQNWAAARGPALQDAVQLAILAFNERSAGLPSPRPTAYAP